MTTVIFLSVFMAIYLVIMVLGAIADAKQLRRLRAEHDAASEATRRQAARRGEKITVDEFPIASIMKERIFRDKDIRPRMKTWRNYAHRLARDLRFKHFVGGIVYRDPASPFDRPARITVLFCYITLNFTATAMFYGRENFALGQTIIVGALGALILLPASGIFNQLFIRVGRAVMNYKKRERKAAEKKLQKNSKLGGKSRRVAPALEAEGASALPPGKSPNLSISVS